MMNSVVTENMKYMFLTRFMNATVVTYKLSINIIYFLCFDRGLITDSLCCGNQLRLSGPVPEIGALLPALTQVRSGILSLIGRRCGWDERSEC